jgi:hypothetical protein
MIALVLLSLLAILAYQAYPRKKKKAPQKTTVDITVNALLLAELARHLQIEKHEVFELGWKLVTAAGDLEGGLYPKNTLGIVVPFKHHQVLIVSGPDVVWKCGLKETADGENKQEKVLN